VTPKRISGAVLSLVAIVAAVAIGMAAGIGIINSNLIGLLTARAPAATATATPGPSPAIPGPSPATPGPSPATPGPSPATRPGAVALEMPAGDECIACHTTAAGGVGTVPVPPIGHPLEGWTNCTSCHADDSLVKTAPGHSGIHAEQCLLCHTATTPAPMSRPHSIHQGLPCLSCHGTKAPLPASMANRSGTTCWLCHQASSAQAPLYLHPTPADGKCLTCHIAGKIGALPDDHDGRTDGQCSACHAPAANPARQAPHDLALREGMCAFCHGPEGRR
jgi:hypothetical protein